MVNLKRIKIPKFEIQVFYNKDIVNAFKNIPNSEYDGRFWTFQLDNLRTVCDIIEPHFPAQVKELINEHSDLYFSQKKRAELQAETSLKGLKDSLVRNILRRIKIPSNLSLFPHQEVGVVFIELAGGRVLVGDAMGLGKTIQVLAWISTQPKKDRFIWITKKLLVAQTRAEVEKWLPNKSVQIIRTGKDKLEEEDITIINYDLVEKHMEELGLLAAQGVVMDEITMITNNKAKRTKAVKTLANRIPKLIGISGTPLRGRPKNFFSFLNMMNPTMFQSEYDFWKKFCDLKPGAFGMNYNGASNMELLHDVLLPLMLRRNRDIVDDMPSFTRKLVELEATKAFWNEYKGAEDKWKQLEEKRRELIEQGYSPNSKEVQKATNSVLGSMAKVRLLVGREKAKQTTEVVSKYLEADEKVVIFTHHKSVREYLMKVFQKYNPISIYGGQSEKEARENQLLFQENPNFPIIIVSTLAGGVGLNLTPAAFAFFVERQWVVDDEEQAEARISRIVGSAPSVTFSYLHIRDTIDDKMEKLSLEKRENTQKVMDGTFNPADNEKISQTAQAELLNQMFDS